ncbi:MAG: ABC-type transport auxiliary lipoprotein family protein, partial [Plesiomonas shigelloides]
DLPGWQVTPTSASANDWQLNTQIERFQGRYDGKVVISGRWLLTHGSQRWQKNFELVLPQNADGYPEMVRVMGAGWQQQAAAIAREVTQLAAGQS